VGSSNLSYPGLTENIELNVQITGRPVTVLQEWYEEHWDKAENVTAEILQVIERHIRDYSPFEVYAGALHELFRRYEMTDKEWLEQKSRVCPILDQYQRDGFHELIDTAHMYRGAFLCDGVGLGKTFVGLMSVEYLIERQLKKVALIVPKSGRKPVWERVLREWVPHLFGEFSNLVILNHSDLPRASTPDRDYPELRRKVRDQADVIIVDEAHHFRNPGIRENPERGARITGNWSISQMVRLCSSSPPRR
jgi:hypothetical protein